VLKSAAAAAVIAAVKRVPFRQEPLAAPARTAATTAALARLLIPAGMDLRSSAALESTSLLNPRHHLLQQPQWWQQQQQQLVYFQ